MSEPELCSGLHSQRRVYPNVDAYTFLYRTSCLIYVFRRPKAVVS